MDKICFVYSNHMILHSYLQEQVSTDIVNAHQLILWQHLTDWISQDLLYTFPARSDSSYQKIFLRYNLRNTVNIPRITKSTVTLVGVVIINNTDYKLKCTFLVITEFYHLTNQLHVSATVLQPSLGRFQEYQRKKMIQLPYWSEILNLTMCFVYNIHNMYITKNKRGGLKCIIIKFCMLG